MNPPDSPPTDPPKTVAGSGRASADLPTAEPSASDSVVVQLPTDSTTEQVVNEGGLSGESGVDGSSSSGRVPPHRRTLGQRGGAPESCEKKLVEAGRRR